jgi:DNA polymerase III delta subunit
MPDLKPAYLITGKDRPKIQRAIERLRSHFDPTSIEHVSADAVDGAEAVAACNALGLFGADKGKLVLVTEVDGHRTKENRLVGGWRGPDVEAVVAYLTDPTPGTVLALVAESVRKDSALAKACLRHGRDTVLAFDVDDKKLAAWVRAQFSDVSAQATPEVAGMLLDLVGESKEELRMEIEKLALWAGGEEIGVLQVEEMVVPRGPVKPWTLTDAWGSRDVQGVLRASARLQRQGSTPTSIAWSLADHVALVSACGRFASEGVSIGDAAKRLKRRSEFPVRKAFAQAEGWDAAELQTATVRLARLDAELKGGSRLPDELLLERALVDVTRGALAGSS